MRIGEIKTNKLTMPLNQESIDIAITANSLKVIEFTTKQGIDSAKLIELYNNGTPIDNFIGCVEITKEEAESLVPVSFPNSSRVINEDETIQMDWIEYCGYVNTSLRCEANPKGKYLIPSINGKFICPIGRKGRNGGTLKNSEGWYGILDAEFRMFADYFGIDRILTKSEMESITQSLVLRAFAKNYTIESIDKLKATELNNLIKLIEETTAIDVVVPSGSLKSDKQRIIKQTLGLLGDL